jgi:hypothetical protein
MRTAKAIQRCNQDLAGYLHRAWVLSAVHVVSLVGSRIRRYPVLLPDALYCSSESIASWFSICIEVTRRQRSESGLFDDGRTVLFENELLLGSFTGTVVFIEDAFFFQMTLELVQSSNCRKTKCKFCCAHRHAHYSKCKSSYFHLKFSIYSFKVLCFTQPQRLRDTRATTDREVDVQHDYEVA